jgi:hypothetical protein
MRPNNAQARRDIQTSNPSVPLGAIDRWWLDVNATATAARPYSGAFSCSTYCLTIDNGSPPHDTMHYERGQNTGLPCYTEVALIDHPSQPPSDLLAVVHCSARRLRPWSSWQTMSKPRVSAHACKRFDILVVEIPILAPITTKLPRGGYAPPFPNQSPRPVASLAVACAADTLGIIGLRERAIIRQMLPVLLQKADGKCRGVWPTPPWPTSNLSPMPLAITVAERVASHSRNADCCVGKGGRGQKLGSLASSCAPTQSPATLQRHHTP